MNLIYRQISPSPLSNFCLVFSPTTLCTTSLSQTPQLLSILSLFITTYRIDTQLTLRDTTLQQHASSDIRDFHIGQRPRTTVSTVSKVAKICLQDRNLMTCSGPEDTKGETGTTGLSLYSCIALVAYDTTSRDKAKEPR